MDCSLRRPTCHAAPDTRRDRSLPLLLRRLGVRSRVPSRPRRAAQFTFAWPLGEGALKPRGATTRGAPIVLDPAPSAAWQRLREPGLSGHGARPARDTGDGRALPRELRLPRGRALRPGAQARRPLPELGHRIRVRERGPPGFHRPAAHPGDARADRRRARSASRSSCGTGGRNGAIEPETLLAYDGANTWARRPLSPEERRGAWVQSVLQVDDSPRYAARGRWEHGDSFSTWLSDETWRPLPRREFSVRKDYQVLVGTNRHTITPSGWVQEENNLKVALDASGKPRAAMPYLAREYGLARYEHIKDYDFGTGRALLRPHRAVLGRSARGLARARAARRPLHPARAGRTRGSSSCRSSSTPRSSPAGALVRSRRRARLRRAHAARQLPRRSGQVGAQSGSQKSPSSRRFAAARLAPKA